MSTQISKDINMYSVDRIREVLTLEPETGVLTWKIGRKKCAAGTVAGRKDSNGYWRVMVDGADYRAHHLVWVLEHGKFPTMLDHINGNKLDNRPANLRECTHTENMQNVGKRRNNTSGVKGLIWWASRSLWQGQIYYKRKRYVYRNAARRAVEEWLVTTRASLAGEFAHD